MLSNGAACHRACLRKGDPISQSIGNSGRSFSMPWPSASDSPRPLGPLSPLGPLAGASPRSGMFHPFGAGPHWRVRSQGASGRAHFRPSLSPLGPLAGASPRSGMFRPFGAGAHWPAALPGRLGSGSIRPLGPLSPLGPLAGASAPVWYVSPLRGWGALATMRRSQGARERLFNPSLGFFESFGSIL